MAESRRLEVKRERIWKGRDEDDELRGSHGRALGLSMEAFVEDDLRTRF